MASSAVTRAAWKEAATARAQLRLGAGAPVPDMVRLLEGSIDGAPVCVLPLPDGVAGAYARRYGRSFLFVNRNEAPVRQRFTLAHEYGHHWMGHQPVIDPDTHINGRSRDPREVAANAFAAELLVPREALREWIDTHFPERTVDLEVLVRAAAFFGVSAVSIRYRAEDAKIVTRPALLKQFDLALEAREHISLKRRLGLPDAMDTLAELHRSGGIHMPSEMEDWALRGYGKGLVPEERLADGLHRSAQEIAALLEERELSPPTDDEPDW